MNTTTFPTPVGLFSLAVNDTGALVATAFGPRDALRDRLPPGSPLTPREGPTAGARAAFEAWFSDADCALDLPMAPVGTPFQHGVWAALCTIPRGETRSYGQLAAELRTSARAVGRANATNPLCVIVPCHRVIGADGSLTGFAFGTTVKHWLLAHEGATP